MRLSLGTAAAAASAAPPSAAPGAPPARRAARCRRCGASCAERRDGGREGWGGGEGEGKGRSSGEEEGRAYGRARGRAGGGEGRRRGAAVGGGRGRGRAGEVRGRGVCGVWAWGAPERGGPPGAAPPARRRRSGGEGGGDGRPRRSRGPRRNAHLLHVVPVRHDAVLDRVLERQHAALALRLVADVGVLLVHADHDARVLGAADDGREDGARRVVAREAGLAHAGAIVHDERLNLLAVRERGRGGGDGGRGGSRR